MDISIKSFDQLNTTELYDLLRLRSEVFVVEQDCVYQDVDGKDQKAMHILGHEGDQLAAYTRVFKAGDYFDMASIGRVVVSPQHRRKDYGKEIMKASMEFAFLPDRQAGAKAKQPIKISAQVYLKKFYEDLGFEETGKRYLEDGIPHMEMVANPE
ncbi:GNAT family N-acetyltransferase [Nonlabens agnitus]|uniref:GNAT family N-acetyltransferase n=1 Tax=Nonlabens agnitus TaxID=870484 RepID=A0A2S9WW91_9FLAO|nr:GNAT family N-acetyltransferase [Nonlabens agnitus]PRP67748.1 GNAT family N-acetyltransferase [Nonlabens agnitus]